MRSGKPSELSKSATEAALAKPPAKSHPRALPAVGSQTYSDLRRQDADREHHARIWRASAVVAATVVLAVLAIWAALKVR